MAGITEEAYRNLASESRAKFDEMGERVSALQGRCKQLQYSVMSGYSMARALQSQIDTIGDPSLSAYVLFVTASLEADVNAFVLGFDPPDGGYEEVTFSTSELAARA